MMSSIAIAPLTDLPHIRAVLVELLVETVASGGSVSFMHPLAPEAADAFWRDSLASAARRDGNGLRRARTEPAKLIVAVGNELELREPGGRFAITGRAIIATWRERST